MADVRQLVLHVDENNIPLDKPPLMHYQDALENLRNEATDLTKWSLINNLIGAYDQIGLKGDPNTATLLDDQDSVNGSYAINTTLMTVTNEQLYTWIWIVEKKSSANGNLGVWGQLAGDTGTKSAAITVNPVTGAPVFLSGAVDGFDYKVVDDVLGNNWIIFVTQTYTDEIDNNSIHQSIYPCRYTTDTSTIDNTLTGNVIVKYAGTFKNTTIEQLINAGPIFSEGTILATDRIAYEHSVENISNESIAMYLECEPEGAGLIAGCFLGYGIYPTFENINFENDEIGWSVLSGDASNTITFNQLAEYRCVDSALSLASSVYLNTVAGIKYIIETNGSVFSGELKTTGFTEQFNMLGDFSLFELATGTGGGLFLTRNTFPTSADIYRFSVSILDATAYPSFRLTDRAGNTITANATVSTRHKIGVVANANEAKFDLYLDGIWVGETPYSGTLHDGVFDMFRLNEYPGGVWNHRTWKGGTLAELKAKIEEQVPMPTYIPIETSPDWETVGGTNPTQVNLLDGVVTQVGDTNPEQAIAYKDYNLADVEVSCIIHHENPSNNIKSFFLAVRMSSVDDAIGLRGYNGIIEIYDRIGGTFTSLLTATPSNAGTIGTRMSLRVKGTQVSAIVDGVEYIAETPTALTASGRVGFLSRGNTLGTVPLASHYLVSEI